MKINKLLTAFIVFLSIPAWSQNVNFEWAKQITGSYATASGNRIAHAKNGGTITIGKFSNTCDLDPGPNTLTLTATGSSPDQFILKLDESGNFEWVKQIGNNSQIAIYDLTIDEDNNILLAGTYGGTLDVDPGSGVTNISDPNQIGGFLLKLNGNGDFVNVIPISNGLLEEVYDVTTDEENNIYVTGRFTGTCDFDPSSSVAQMTSQASNDGFVASYKADCTFRWCHQMRGTSDERGWNIAYKTGALLVSGTFEGVVDLNPTGNSLILTPESSYNDLFFMRLDTIGTFDFGGAFHGNSNNKLILDIALNSSGEMFFVGSKNGPIDFDPDTSQFILTNPNTRQPFLCKLNEIGEFEFAYQLNGGAATSIVVDEFDAVYVGGWFYGLQDFDLSTGVSNLQANGSAEVFIWKMDSNSGLIWAKQFNGTSFDQVNGIAIGSNNEIYTTGFFEGVNDFDPGSGVSNLTSSVGGFDVFINKLNQDELAVSKFDQSTIKVFPNPFRDKVSFQFSATADCELFIMNSIGQEVYVGTLKKGEQTFELSPGLEEGIYIYSILQEMEMVGSGKLIVE